MDLQFTKLKNELSSLETEKTRLEAGLQVCLKQDGVVPCTPNDNNFKVAERERGDFYRENLIWENSVPNFWMVFFPALLGAKVECPCI